MNDIIETLIDPKCGTYYNHATDEYICVAKVDGEYIQIGAYSKVGTLQENGKEFKRMVERKIWNNFSIHGGKNEPRQA